MPWRSTPEKINQIAGDDRFFAKQIDETLRENEERFRRIVNSSPMGIHLYRLEPDDRLVFIGANPAADLILGVDHSKFFGMSIEEAFPPLTQTEVPERYRRACTLGESWYTEQIDYQDQQIRGAFEVHAFQTAPGNMAAIFTDITERKLAEQKLLDYQNQLRSLSAELSLIEERERRLIARDLHDNLGQALALAKIKLGVLQEQTSHENGPKQLQEVADLLAESIDYTRSLTSKVSPQILYALPFSAAVEWLAEQLLLNNGIQVEILDDDQPKPLSDDCRVLLFKTVRELLMNIVKHAQATRATIHLQRVDAQFLIEINDNGQGFDALQQERQATSSQGYGLFSILEHMTYLGGEMGIISPPDQGTHISILVPLEEKS